MSSAIIAKFDLSGLPEVLTAANKRVVENERRSFYRTTQNWSSENKPTFNVEISATYYGGINDYEVSTDSIIYKWIDEGTKPHTIEAVNAPTLRFKDGYEPKTTRGKLTSSGSGKSFGNWMAPKKVEHSGIEAREFTLTIKSKARDRWQKAIETEINKYIVKKVK